jgi:hypothetical protein
MVWLCVKFHELAQNPATEKLGFGGNPMAQGLAAFIVTYFATELLVWLIWLPRRLQYRWQYWRSNRRASKQALHNH